MRHIISRQPASPEREICWKSWDRIWPASEFDIKWIFLFKCNIFSHNFHLKQFELLGSSFFICINIYPCFLSSPAFPWAQQFQNASCFGFETIWSDLSCGAVSKQLLHLHLVYHCFSSFPAFYLPLYFTRTIFVLLCFLFTPEFPNSHTVFDLRRFELPRLVSGFCICRAFPSPSSHRGLSASCFTPIPLHESSY